MKIFFRVLAVAAVAFVLTANVSAYDNSFSTLSVSGGVFAPSGELTIQHVFYDSIPLIPQNGFFVAGANLLLGMRVNPLEFLSFNASYITLEKGVLAGTMLKLRIKEIFLRLGMELDYLTYLSSVLNSRSHGMLIVLSAQTEPLFGGRFTAAVNAGFDTTVLRFSGGMGLSFTPIQPLSILAEAVLPFTGINNTGTETALPALSFTVKLDTAGHHFMLTFANNPYLGMPKMSGGAPDMSNWYVGFTIRRLFEF